MFKMNANRTIIRTDWITQQNTIEGDIKNIIDVVVLAAGS
jgi:hypothetical protein